MFSLREPTLIIINNTLISHYFFSEQGKHKIDKNFRFFRDFCVQRKKETDLSSYFLGHFEIYVYFCKKEINKVTTKITQI